MDFVIAILLSFSVVVLVALISFFETRTWNKHMVKVEGVLRDVAERYGRPELDIPTKTLEVLLSDRYLHYFDLRKAEVCASFPIDAITSLEIQVTSVSHISFSFNMGGGKKSPTFSTDQVSRFTDLFNLMIGSGKEIRYKRG